jgi:hypothetical protein
MKHTMAMARQVHAAEEQAELTRENNLLLKLICDKLGISPGGAELADDTAEKPPVVPGKGKK